jgi:hypothetical protein
MAEATPSQRFISTIGFPYMDLDDAIGVAKTMLAAGGVTMDRDQLAAAMGQVPTSGNFNMKVAAARLFGLVDVAQGRYQLTPLGFEILDSARERAAKAAAFLNVPLYRRVFDTFRGRQLPPRPIGLENALVEFGVSPRQKDKARQAFDRSARTAGFFQNQAEDRLVQPVIGPQLISEAVSTGPPLEVTHIYEIPATEPARPAMHSFISGLLETLPPVKSEWSSQARAKWLQAAAQIFDLLYEGGDGEIIVTLRKAEQ